MEANKLHTKIFSCQTREDKKSLLKSLSVKAKEIIENEGLDLRVNDFLLNWYRTNEHQEFNNFWEWKKKGYSVKKGEKAFFIWSKKRTGTEKGEKPEDDKEFKFFSLAYLFSNAQVEPISKGDAENN